MWVLRLPSIVPFQLNMLEAHQVRMLRDPMLWSCRPIQADLLQYASAAEDVLPLLLLADELKAEMGKAESALVSKLSQHWCPS